jgi:ribosomal protein S18
VYVLHCDQRPAELVTELDRRLRVFDLVVRHLVVRVDEELAIAERARVRRKTNMASRRVRRGLPPEPTEQERNRRREEDRRHGRPGDGLPGRRPMSDFESRGRSNRDKDKDDKDKKGGGRRTFFRRRRVCKFCVDKIDYISYKDVRLLASFIPERGKIPAAAHFRRVRPASACAAACDQARAADRARAVRGRLKGAHIMSIEVILKEHVGAPRVAAAKSSRWRTVTRATSCSRASWRWQSRPRTRSRSSATA